MVNNVKLHVNDDQMNVKVMKDSVVKMDKIVKPTVNVERHATKMPKKLMVNACVTTASVETVLRAQKIKRDNYSPFLS